MQDLPSEVVDVLLKKSEKKDYQSIASLTKRFSNIAVTEKSLMTFSSEDTGNVTSFYNGYQLSSYQHKMLVHLIAKGTEAAYTCIPDHYNLTLISLLYITELSKSGSVAIFCTYSLL